MELIKAGDNVPDSRGHMAQISYGERLLYNGTWGIFSRTFLHHYGHFSDDMREQRESL